MKQTLIILGLAAIAILVVVQLYLHGWFHAKQLSADDLEKTALADASSEAQQKEQQKAATALIGLGQPALANIRRVFHASKSPEVRAIMLLGIAQTRDMDSSDDVFKALDDDSFLVRIQAISAIKRLYFFAEVFPPDAKHDERVAKIKGLHEVLAKRAKQAELEIEQGRGNKNQGQK